MMKPTDWNSIIESFFAGPSLFGYDPDPLETRREVTELVCPSCGETASELRKTGLLGCALCYDTFENLLLPVFSRAQGHTRHVAAKTMQRQGPLERLKADLETAILNEAYEEAARLRDEIRKIEAENP